jgi:hypothetical protein
LSRPERALVRRAGRKQHFATRAAGAESWVPVCEVREIPAFGAEVTARESWQAWLDAARLDDGTMCVRCRNPLLVAEQVEQLQAEVRSLRATSARWATAALAETKKHGAFVREHVVFRRAAR